MVDLAGGGLVESIADTVKSAADADEWIDLGDVVVNSAAVGLDALGFMANPIDSVATSAIAWIIEHLEPLRMALDWTTADPDGIQNAITSWNDLATTLDGIANTHRSAPERYAPTWVNGGSDSAVSCTDVMAFRADQISGASMACIGMAQQTASAGKWLSAARSVIRDLIAEFVWELLKKAATRLSFAPFTFGASVGDFIMNTVIGVSRLLKKIGKILTRVADKLKEISGRLTKLADFVEKALSMTARTETKVYRDLGSLYVRGITGVPLKYAVEAGKEYVKVDSVERQSSGPPPNATDEQAQQAERDAERVDEMHDQYHAGVNPRIRTDQAKNPEEIEQTPPGPLETKDWWTRKGTL